MRLAIFIPTLLGGGAERVMSIVARGFAERGHEVDFLVASSAGPYRELIPDEVRLIDFKKKGVLGCLLPLAGYLRRERPVAIYSAMSHTNVIALAANALAGSPARVIVSERASYEQVRAHHRSLANRATRVAMRYTYGRADKIVVVAEAIADELHRHLGLPRSRMVALPNPVVTPEIAGLAQQTPETQIFDAGKPVILGAGRLTFQKDFETLIRAFGIVRGSHDARLAIIGEGPDREQLQHLIEQLGLGGVVELAGFVSNPFAWMRAASVFVLSSRYEGLPGVLIQAMACGTAVVSTDCPTGPREILQDGKWGPLVPVGDPDALARAVVDQLTSKHRPDVRLRAQDFSERVAVDGYLDLALSRRTLTRPGGLAQSGEPWDPRNYQETIGGGKQA